MSFFAVPCSVFLLGIFAARSLAPCEHFFVQLFDLVGIFSGEIVLLSDVVFQVV